MYFGGSVGASEFWNWQPPKVHFQVSAATPPSFRRKLPEFPRLHPKSPESARLCPNAAGIRKNNPESAENLPKLPEAGCCGIAQIYGSIAQIRYSLCVGAQGRGDAVPGGRHGGPAPVAVAGGAAPSKPSTLSPQPSTLNPRLAGSPAAVDRGAKPVHHHHSLCHTRVNHVSCIAQ